MSKRKYRVRVCDGEACRDVGKATSSINQAKKRLRKAVDAMSKKRLKKVGEGDFAVVRGEVWATERGKIVDAAPVYVDAHGAGSPTAGRRPRRRAAEAE